MSRCLLQRVEYVATSQDALALISLVGVSERSTAHAAAATVDREAYMRRLDVDNRQIAIPCAEVEIWLALFQSMVAERAGKRRQNVFNTAFRLLFIRVARLEMEGVLSDAPSPGTFAQCQSGRSIRAVGWRT